MPCARESQGLLGRKKEAPRRLTHRTLCNALKICKLGGGTSESNIEYLDVSGLGETNEFLRNSLVLVADIVKSKNEEGTFVGACLTGIQHAFGITTNNATTCVAVAVDFSRHIKCKGDEGALDLSIAELIIMMVGVTQEQLDSLPRLTKEQFYTLE